MLGKFRQKGAVRISLIAATLSTAGILLATASAGADELKPHAASAKPSLQFLRKAPPLAEPSRFWLGAEFLLWSTKRASLPPLATVGDSADPFPSALGQPGTRVLFGGGPDGSSRTLPGFRLRGGYAITNDWALEAGGFLLRNRSTQFAAQSGAGGLPVIGRPVVDALAGNENTYVDSFPGAIAGGIVINSSTSFWGLEANAAKQLSGRGSAGPKFEVLFGTRYLRLHDQLLIQDNFAPTAPGILTFLGGPADPPTTMSDFDRFTASNDFYGAQLGVRSSLTADRWSFGGSGKLALGITRQTVGIDGATSLLTPGAPTLTAPGGVLAQVTNIGTYKSNQFAFVPELELNAGYEIFPNAVIRVGYNLIYWSNVVRAGEQIDRTVNGHIVPSDQTFGTPGGPARPAFTFNRTDYWAQGLNLGFNYRF
jgi:hypothetical protein